MAKSTKPAKVTLDAGTTAKIESTLRAALVNASAANIVTVPKPSKAQKTTAVALDAATVSRFAKHLRAGLQGSAAINIAENAAKKPRKAR